MRIAHLRKLTSVLLLFAGCGGREPFHHVPVSGKITYEDGSLIPVDEIEVRFLPQAARVDAKTYPRPGEASVDKATGTFSSATTHKANDGLVQGKHKVILTSPGVPLPPSIVPPEYCDPTTTPLEVDTANQPFLLKVRKPSR
jgi:hypothetical protein